MYKGSFSLAYGTHTLLRDTMTHLKRDRFYGLPGPNQCGKTTLLRAIANGLLVSFLMRDELKSVSVKHEVEDEEVGVQNVGSSTLSVCKPGQWRVMHTCSEVYKRENKVTEEQCKELMMTTGFGYPGGPDRVANLDWPVTCYPAGWKMKMQHCADQPMNCDELMLDEPTGHLGVDKFKWLEPSNEMMRFTLPVPGTLEGVSRSKVVLRLAYVAQHASHHLEKHVQETPAQYIMWRFGDAGARGHLASAVQWVER